MIQLDRRENAALNIGCGALAAIFLLVFGVIFSDERTRMAFFDQDRILGPREKIFGVSIGMDAGTARQNLVSRGLRLSEEGQVGHLPRRWTYVCGVRGLQTNDILASYWNGTGSVIIGTVCLAERDGHVVAMDAHFGFNAI